MEAFRWPSLGSHKRDVPRPLSVKAVTKAGASEEETQALPRRRKMARFREAWRAKENGVTVFGK